MVYDQFVRILLILDLPKLHTISYQGSFILAGDSRDSHMNTMDERYDNVLIMKSELNWHVHNVEIIL